MNPVKFNVLLKYLDNLVVEHLQCKYCLDVFENTEQLKIHSTTVHVDKRFVCDFCLKEFKRNYYLAVHIGQFHMCISLPKAKPKYYPKMGNNSADDDYNPSPDPDSDICEEDVIYPRECEQCNYEIPQRKDHYKHYLYMHSDIIDKYPFKRKPVKCPICGLFKGTHHARNHAAIESGIQLKCPSCDKHFASTTRLRTHRNNVHRKRILTCHFCSKNFQSKTDIQRHLRIHTGEKPFKCEICGAGFAHSGNRQIHMRSAHKIVQPSAKEVSAKETESKDVVGGGSEVIKRKRGRPPSIKKVEEQVKGKKGRGKPRKKKIANTSSEYDSDGEALSELIKRKKLDLK